MLYLSLFYAPISGLGQLLEQMQQAYAGAERVMAVLDAPIEIQNSPRSKDLGRAKGCVSFEHVNFSYESGRPILKDTAFPVNREKWWLWLARPAWGKPP